MLDDSYAPHGRHLIAGDWVAGEATFRSAPATGEASTSPSARPTWSTAPPRRPKRPLPPMATTSREERAAFLEPIADEIEARGGADHRHRHARDRPARRPARGRARPHHRPAAAVRQPHPRGRLSRPPARRGAARPPAAAASRPADDPAPDRPGRGVRRVELPARLLDRGRRHRRRARRRLPGRGQGPLRPSRHRRDRGRGDPRGDPGAAACRRASSR